MVTFTNNIEANMFLGLNKIYVRKYKYRAFGPKNTNLTDYN